MSTDGKSYEVGYRDGESSRSADVLLLFYDACTMDDMLAGFREVMSDPGLEWPEDAAGVWVVIDEDRHDDIGVFPFSTEERAVEYARALAGIGGAAYGEEIGEGVSDPEDADILGEKELTPGMREDGWVFLARYSIEGDSVRVVKRQMNAAGE